MNSPDATSDSGSPESTAGVLPGGGSGIDLFDRTARCTCPLCTGKISITQAVASHSEYNLETGLITPWTSAPPNGGELILAGVNAASFDNAWVVLGWG